MQKEAAEKEAAARKSNRAGKGRNPRLEREDEEVEIPKKEHLYLKKAFLTSWFIFSWLITHFEGFAYFDIWKLNKSTQMYLFFSSLKEKFYDYCPDEMLTRRFHPSRTWTPAGLKLQL